MSIKPSFLSSIPGASLKYCVVTDGVDAGAGALPPPPPPNILS